MTRADQIAQRVAAKAEVRAFKRASHLGEIALDQHLNARRDPTTGRSVAGGAPAEDTGDLRKILAEPPERVANGYRTSVNYSVLEYGYANNNLAPRPNGRLASAKLKTEVNRES